MNCESFFNNVSEILNSIYNNANILCDTRIYPMLFFGGIAFTREKIISLMGLDDVVNVHINMNLGKTYYYDGSLRYCVIFPVRRGTSSISYVLDENGNNVTEKIIEAMGVGKNFHGIPTTPRMIGYHNLTISNIDGDISTYGENDLINT